MNPPRPTRRALLVAVASSLMALCLTGAPDGPTPTPAAEGSASFDWLFLEAGANESGAIHAFRWTVPGGATTFDEIRQRHVLAFDFAPIIREHDAAKMREWAFFVFDRFVEGPHSGMARPQMTQIYPEGTEYEGFPTTERRAYAVLRGPGDFELLNRTGFEGLELTFLVMAKATEPVEFGLAIDAVEGYHRFLPAERPTSKLPTTWPEATRSGHVRRPDASATGFDLAVFYEYIGTAGLYGFDSSGITIVRTPDLGRPSLAGGLELEARFESTRGWTWVSLLQDQRTHVASFELDGDYRGRRLVASSPSADAGGLVRTHVGSLAVPPHFVYRDGDGVSSFRLKMTYADSASVHQIELLKVDLAVPLSDLIEPPVFELWQQRPRLGDPIDANVATDAGG